MNEYITIFNMQTGAIQDYVLAEKSGEKGIILPILYYWLKSQGKEGDLKPFWMRFDEEILPIVKRESEEAGRRAVEKTYGKYFVHFKLTEENLPYLKDICSFLEFFHSEQLKEKGLFERTAVSMKAGKMEKSKVYVDAVGELIFLYKRFMLND